MFASSAHQPEIAREVPSPRLSDRPAGGCLLPAPRPVAIIHNQHQTDSHSRGGAPLGLRCDYRPAVGRIHGRGLFPAARGYDLPDYHLAGAFIGSGPFVNLRRQPRRQALADLLPSHFPMSFRNHRLDSHDANENGLTNAETSFAPGAKAHD